VEYYANFEAPKYWSELLLKTDVSRKLLQHRPRVEKIVALLKEKFAKGEIAAVDLGAGTGAFALALRDSGFFRKVIAVDFSKDCVQACVKRGLESHQGTVDDVTEDSIGLLTMNDLIEHLSEPLLFLKKCCSIMTPKGMIAIATPNGGGFDFQIMKEKTVNITPPEHLNYFNTYSIKLLIENAGFSVKKVETPGILDTQIVMREVARGNINLGRDNKFLQYLLGETSSEVVGAFQRFLQENLLSSHMLALAQKR
jgi:2-polyprenyl-3-methyl-5-hydroxy-6-metoxy-1,4-benzoquinol methylase